MGNRAAPFSLSNRDNNGTGIQGHQPYCQAADRGKNSYVLALNSFDIRWINSNSCGIVCVAKNGKIQGKGAKQMPTVKTLLPKTQSEEKLLRVAAYCRVSSDSTDQEHSFAAQVKYYTELIGRNPKWTLADIYSDATVIIGLKQNPTYGRRFSPIFFIIGHFVGQNAKCYYEPRRKKYGMG